MFENRFVYDERRKELTASKNWTMKGEAEIKKLLSDLTTQKDGYEKQLSQLRKTKLEMPVTTEELTKLKDQLTMLQKIDKVEKINNQIKEMEENIKNVKKDIDKIKQAIGSRLKLAG